MRALRHAALAAFALALCASPAAHAFNRGTSNWNPASLPISYRVNLASVPSSLGATAAQAAIENGMATWSAPACTRWRATNAGTTSVTAARSGDGENSFLWISGSWPAELGSVNVTIGVTTPVWRSGGYFIDADIQYNNVGFRWNTTGNSGFVDAQSIATHEQGHFLGLDHTTVRGAVMYPSYAGGQVRNLSSDDTAGVCAIYPSGAAVPDAGTTVDAGVSTDPCSRYTSCAGCTPVNGCGWCGASNSCVSSTQTGPTRGACASGFAWLPQECTTATPTPDAGTTTDPCNRFTSCAGCTPINGCGWCGASNTCVSSTQTGPTRGTCASGFAWLPQECTTATADAGTTPVGGTAAFGEPCRSPADCASGGICVSSATSGAFCTQACVDDCSCPRGFRCGGRISTGQTVCIEGTNTCSDTDAGSSVDAAAPPPPDAPRADVTQTDVTSPGDTGGKSDASVDDATAGDASDESSFTGGSGGSAPRGCGCSVPAPSRPTPFAYVTALAGLALAVRRRRR